MDAERDLPLHSERGPRGIVELTRERDEALAVASAERRRSTVLLQHCELLASEIDALRRQVDWANATIHNMERSWFWRMRLVTVRIRHAARGLRRLGRARGA